MIASKKIAKLEVKEQKKSDWKHHLDLILVMLFEIARGFSNYLINILLFQRNVLLVSKVSYTKNNIYQMTTSWTHTDIFC